jgi:hypothetical protein
LTLHGVAQDKQPQHAARRAENHLLHAVDGRSPHVSALDFHQHIVDSDLSRALCSAARD